MKMEKALKYVSGFMRIITLKQVFNDKIAPTCGLKNTNTFFTDTVTAPACVFWWISMFKLKTDSRYISLSLFHSLSETDKKKCLATKTYIFPLTLRTFFPLTLRTFFYVGTY